MSMRTFVALSTAASVLAASAGAFALDGTFSSDGSKQKFGADKLVGLKYEVKSPRDIATGQASGKRQHAPVCIYKAGSATSAQYFQATVNNEVLKSVSIELSNGVHIKLTTANVASFAILDTDGKDLEEVCFTFQKIEISQGKGVVAMDDWMK